MRLVTFAQHGVTHIGLQTERHGGQYILDLNAAQPALPHDMQGFLDAGDMALEAARHALAGKHEKYLIPAGDVTLLAPLPRPGKLVCLGHNYYDHMEGGRTDPPEFPTLFCKTTNTVIGPGQSIVVPKITAQVDYEAELAVVIGKRCHHVSQAQALEYVAGYTIFNDVSSRDFQKRTSQWMIGKSFDTFGPMGPWLVTADEIADPGQLEMSLTLNGLELQRTNTRHMIFSVPFIIAYLSEVMTLEAGDLISTGTPAKTPLAKTIPPFMKAGDRVAITIEKLGELANPVVAEA
jgi:acylpyruvate hydrolase